MATGECDVNIVVEGGRAEPETVIEIGTESELQTEVPGAEVPSQRCLTPEAVEAIGQMICTEVRTSVQASVQEEIE